MFWKLHERLHRIAWARMGGVLLVLSALLEVLDKLGEIDITPIIAHFGYDPAFVLAIIGVAKIILRISLSTAAAMRQPDAPEAK